MCRSDDSFLPGVTEEYKKAYRKGQEFGEKWGRIDQYVKCAKEMLDKDIKHHEAGVILELKL